MVPLLLLAVLVGLIGLHWAILPDPSRRNYEFLPNMVESQAIDAQSPYAVLADGTTVDPRPPDGSVARGYLPLAYEPTPEGARLAGIELSNPIAADDPGALSRGSFVYANFCAVCHGPTGRGDGAATTRGVPPPPSLLLDHAMQMSDGQMFHVVSLGQGNMASYASQLERADRWRAIHHIRRLQAQSVEEPTRVAAAEVRR